MIKRLVVALSMVVGTACNHAHHSKGTSEAATKIGERANAEADAPMQSQQSGVDRLMLLGGSTSTSIRNSNDGSLLGGVPLPDSAPGLRFVSKRKNDARYGTIEMVQALLRSSESVHRKLKGNALIVNDLSLRHGGAIDHHDSHQSGRDVDVLFYYLDSDNESTLPVGAFVDREGNAIDFKDLADPSDDVHLKIDLPRTWIFVESLLRDSNAAVQRIFVAEHIERLLTAHAISIGTDDLIVSRFKQTTCQPSSPHDDHFHIRVYCSVDDIKAGCRDNSPVFDWRRSELSAAGVKSLKMLPRRARAKSQKVTVEEARRNAGPLDAEVERWLERRQRWLKPSASGRCR